ncbi:hypothetical protein JHK82_037764 [Glycine max]|uniref:Uncharacterized protein n=1 Tax=Glycine max TaxID=3847 RepID=K7M2V8_SOYBN|nr:hypothetical protein JHK87_037713 [Glycine soja]KAG4972096.1 hypothetical protein JHK85_038517 [Glycine max]KAG4978485.1 hypothetical protein JHK86_037959 [Glycine max]KAG5114495.1 hypothetical protein JHK82_037764 [Glycine max]KAG5131778.1 hypothetical protein JHK84_038175 [Glycine max]
MSSFINLKCIMNFIYLNLRVCTSLFVHLETNFRGGFYCNEATEISKMEKAFFISR